MLNKKNEINKIIHLNEKIIRNFMIDNFQIKLNKQRRRKKKH